jgi:hypothetical protein
MMSNKSNLWRKEQRKILTDVNDLLLIKGHQRLPIGAECPQIIGGSLEPRLQLASS